MKYCEVNNCRYPHSHVTSGHRCGKCYQYGHGFIECGDLDKINNLKNNYHYQRLPYKLWCKKNGCRYFWSHNCRAHHCNNCGNNHSQIDCPISNNNTVNNLNDNIDINSEESTNSVINEIPIENFSSEDLSENYGETDNTEDSDNSEDIDNSEDFSDIISISSSETIESELVSTSILVNNSPSCEILNNKVVKLDCPMCRKKNTVFFSKHRAYGITNKCNVCMVENIEIFLPECGHTVLCRNCCIRIGTQIDNFPSPSPSIILSTPSPTIPPSYIDEHTSSSSQNHSNLTNYVSTYSPSIPNIFTTMNTPHTHFPHSILNPSSSSEANPPSDLNLDNYNSPSVSPSPYNYVNNYNSPSVSPSPYNYVNNYNSPYPVPTPAPPSPILINNSIEHLSLITINNLSPLNGSNIEIDFPSNKIVEVTNLFGSTPGPIYTIMYAGGNNNWYIRRLSNTSNNWDVFYLRVNSSNHGLLNEFKLGYQSINNDELDNY
jgi:hypothetical protein